MKNAAIFLYFLAFFGIFWGAIFWGTDFGIWAMLIGVGALRMGLYTYGPTSYYFEKKRREKNKIRERTKR